MHTLFSWLGNRDIENMLDGQPAAIATTIAKSETPVDKVVILANQYKEEWQKFKRFLQETAKKRGQTKIEINIFEAKIQSPIHYESIYQEASKWLHGLSKESSLLSINLTSGTPAMATLSVLVGSGIHNSNFVQSTPKNELYKVEIPASIIQAPAKSAAKNTADAVINDLVTDKAFSDLTINSSVMKESVEKAKRIARTDVPALILGETGTGKELLANAIHNASLRCKEKMKAVNCGAFPETLVDSILFGHVKGAFTGAEKSHQGLFEQAHNSTLFLDEVGELSLAIQAKLLRVLQEDEITPVGSTKTKKVNVRIIAATHRDLPKMVANGEFREDLFYRLAVGVVNLPALRERQDDIPDLLADISTKLNKQFATDSEYVSKKVSPKGINFIKSQPWRGNIRELMATIQRSFLWSDKGTITDTDIASAIINRVESKDTEDVNLSFSDKIDIVQLTEKYQKKYVLSALKASGNVKKQATQILGLKDHQTLSNWMKRLGIESDK